MLMINHNLRIFSEVAEAGNITDAARKLYISQSSVSQAVKKLETELSLTLFYRNKKGVVLTEAGRDVLLMTRQMLDLENRITQYSYDRNHLRGGVLRIASVPVATTQILTPVLQNYRQQYPDVQIEVHEGDVVQVRRMIEEYRVDLGFGTAENSGLDHIEILRDRIVSVSNTMHEQIDLYETEQPLIFCTNSHEAVLDRLKERDIPMRNSLIVEMPVSLLHMVRSGLGIGIMSEMMVAQYNMPGLHMVPISPRIEMDISLLARDMGTLPPAAAELKRRVLEV